MHNRLTIMIRHLLLPDIREMLGSRRIFCSGSSPSAAGLFGAELFKCPDSRLILLAAYPSLYNIQHRQLHIV